MAALRAWPLLRVVTAEPSSSQSSSQSSRKQQAGPEPSADSEQQSALDGAEHSVVEGKRPTALASDEP